MVTVNQSTRVLIRSLMVNRHSGRTSLLSSTLSGLERQFSSFRRQVTVGSVDCRSRRVDLSRSCTALSLRKWISKRLGFPANFFTIRRHFMTTGLQDRWVQMFVNSSVSSASSTSGRPETITIQVVKVRCTTRRMSLLLLTVRSCTIPRISAASWRDG